MTWLDRRPYGAVTVEWDLAEWNEADHLDDPRHGWDDWIKRSPVRASATELREFNESEVTRDERGRFGEGGGAGDSAPVKCGNDLDKAARLLGQGRKVELSQPDQVSTFLDKLAALANDAKDRGEKAPTYNLCDVSVPGTNLFCNENIGIERVHMPQLSGVPTPGSAADRLEHDSKGEVNASERFVQALKDTGVQTEHLDMPASHLRASQSELVGAKVAGMMRAIENNTMPPGTIFVTRDNYVLDGHHRWAATVGVDSMDGKLGNMTMPVVKIDMEIGAALDFATKWSADFGIAPKLGASALMRALQRSRASAGVVMTVDAGMADIVEWEMIDEHTRLYSEDQERDDHGRFGSGGTLDTTIGKTGTGAKAVLNSLRDRSGKPLMMSASALSNDLTEVRPGVPISDATRKNVQVDVLTATANAALQGTEKNPCIGPDHMEGHDVASIHDNFGRIADSAIQRYAAEGGAQLREGDRFYEQWNHTSAELSKETGIQQERVIAAMAALSPGKDTRVELREVSDLTRMMAMNDGHGPQVEHPGEQAALFDKEAGALREKIDNPKTLGNDRTKYEDKATKLEYSSQVLREAETSGKPAYANDLPGLGAARFLHEYEKTMQDMGPVPLHPGAPVEYEKRGREGAGFSTGKTGFGNYEKTIDVLRGYSVGTNGEQTKVYPADRDTLSGVKVRSFFNNIADPHDRSGNQSVTMDFHMADAGLNVSGMTNFTNWESSPSVMGVSLGVRPFLADETRALVPRMSEALGEKLSPARVQEILWAELNRIERGDMAYANGLPYAPYDLPNPKKK